MKEKAVVFITLLLALVFALHSEVKNPDKPLKGEWDLKPELVWQLKGIGDDDVFAMPEFVVSQDGTCYVHDYMKGMTYIFDSKGNFKKAFGKRGEGPGEIKFHGLSFLVNDKFVAMDMDRLHYFSKNGEFLKAVPYNREFIEFFINEEEFISFSMNKLMFLTTSLPDKLKVTHVNMKTNIKNVIKEFSYKDPNTKHPSYPNRSIRLPGLHSEIIIGCDYDNKKIYYGINDTYTIYVADLNGNVVNSFSVVNRKRKSISKEEIRQSYGVMQLKPLMEEKADFPEQLTYFSRIQIAGGFVYVFSGNYGVHCKNLQIDIFSSEGKYLYRSYFTPRKDANIYFPLLVNHNIILIKGGHLYVVLEDDKGEIAVDNYNISLPKL